MAIQLYNEEVDLSNSQNTTKIREAMIYSFAQNIIQTVNISCCVTYLSINS